MIECLLFFVLFIEEPLRGQKKRKREKEVEKEEVTHNTLFIYCHTFLKEQDFILPCDTQYQGSFFALILLQKNLQEQNRQEKGEKKKMTEGTLHSLL